MMVIIRIITFLFLFLCSSAWAQTGLLKAVSRRI